MRGDNNHQLTARPGINHRSIPNQYRTKHSHLSTSCPHQFILAHWENGLQTGTVTFYLSASLTDCCNQEANIDHLETTNLLETYWYRERRDG